MASTLLADTESLALGALSQSTGSILIDGAVGALIGYYVAPRRARTRYAVGGAVATGLGGVIGALATVGFAWASKKDRRR